jgi:hypothetical protein
MVHKKCALEKTSDNPSLYWKRLWSESMVFSNMILLKWDVGSMDRITMYLKLGCILLEPCRLWYMCGSVGTIIDDNVDNDDDIHHFIDDCSRTIWYKMPKI